MCKFYLGWQAIQSRCFICCEACKGTTEKRHWLAQHKCWRNMSTRKEYGKYLRMNGKEVLTLHTDNFHNLNQWWLNRVTNVLSRTTNNILHRLNLLPHNFTLWCVFLKWFNFNARLVRGILVLMRTSWSCVHDKWMSNIIWITYYSFK
jgi:hypothetical protein